MILLQLAEGLQSMMFVELLFWKNAATAEDVGKQYNWKVSLYGARASYLFRCKSTLYSMLIFLTSAWEADMWGLGGGEEGGAAHT